jgi:NAD-dependent deacetylase
MSQVLELHGNASYAACLECGLRHELETLRQSFIGRDEIPACRECGGLVKVATISFGQAMPREVMRKAEAETLACDLFIVLGSSLAVYPAAGLPLLAKRNGAKLAIVNRDPTEQDRFADLVIRDEIGPLMARIAPPCGR